MTYKLCFYEHALKGWRKLRVTIQLQFKKKLAECLENPKVSASALSGMQDCYKIKLQQAGYRLIYLVKDDIVYITVIAIGKRDRSKIYEMAMHRLGNVS